MYYRSINMKIIGLGIGMVDKQETADSLSLASNPGRVKVNFLLWTRYYPKWPLILITTLFISLILSAAYSRLFILLVLVILGVNYAYWKIVSSHFLNGCINPAVVISVRPLLIAVYSDLSKGQGDYPTIKIIPVPLTSIYTRFPEVGMRLATISLYWQGSDQMPHWVDFTPYPAECATSDSATNVRILESITENQWAYLQASLAVVPEPRQAGLYPIDLTALTETANQYQSDHTMTQADISLSPITDSMGMTQYCLDFPCVEERILSAEERSTIEASKKRAKRLMIAEIIGCLVLLALISVTTTLLVSIHSLFSLLIPGSMIIIFFLGLMAREHFRHTKACSVDLATGTMRTFRGFLKYDNEFGFDKEKSFLMRKRVIRKDIKKDQTLELAGSGRIIRANGNPVSIDFMPVIANIASQPAFAAIARQAEWMEQVGKTKDDEPLLANRRELSTIEHEELRLLSKQTLSGLVTPILLFTAGVAFALFRGLTNHSNIFHMPIFYLAILGVLLSVGHAIINIRKANRLRKAEQFGILIIIRVPAGKYQSLTPTQTDDDVIELFPNSPDIIWTINGEAAPWRKKKP